MKKKDIQQFSTLFKALGDPNRLAMLAQLCGSKQANVGQLSKCCDVDISVVSRHLSKLKDVGIVCCQKEGKEVLYQLETTKLVSDLRKLANTIEKATTCCL